jgi:DNA-binding NarL/FixJ family response regulator
VKRTVLLVEDEDDTRELLGRALERQGYICIAAEGRSAALAKAKEADFVDVVVTDVVMDKDDRAGLRLLRELRDAKIYAPVVVITAHADVEKVKNALNEGARYLLEKPFRAEELVSAVARACEHGGGSAHAVLEVITRAKLTDKERAVALHVLEGLSSGEIAALENNSERTIRQHVSQIYAKCGVSSRAEFFRKVYVR